jgi:hypothetical protein
MTKATREEAFAAVAALNEVIATLNCAGIINAATRRHEIDLGYGKLETATSVIAPLAASIWSTRHEARAVCIPDGSYDWAVRLCDIATGDAHQLRNIEMRAV